VAIFPVNINQLPLLLPMVAVDDAQSANAARTIVRLLQGISPSQFAWVDREVRRASYGVYHVDNPWSTFSPERVYRACQSETFDPVVIGLFGSHRNGFVRAAVLECLAGVVDGREIPFLALRANDWVPPVAARAAQLLMQRLRPENLGTVLAMLPFFVRMLGPHRRDHHELLQVLRSVLLSDGGDAALRRAASFDTGVRRRLYDLLDNPGADAELRIVKAALNDPDAVIRVRALRRLASIEGTAKRATVFERFVHEDPVPAVRRLALSSLSIAAPGRMAAVVPSALLDRAARMRALARSLVVQHKLTVVPRDIYIQRLKGAAIARELAAAIEGLGETGNRADLPLLAPFLENSTGGVRRAALSATVTLDVEGAIPQAIAALDDEARSVRTVAVRILKLHASRAEFEVVSRRVRALADPSARRMLMPLLRAAPKWDAAVYLLEGLTDGDEKVRTVASTLLDGWLDDFNRSQVTPDADQMIRIRQLLDLVGGQLSTEAMRLMRLSIASL
jgi:hypothetical protein